MIRIATLFAAALALAGCNKSSAETTKPAATIAPVMKDYAPPPEARLGVLAPNTGIPVGQKVPDAHGLDLHGNDVTLASLYAKGPILLAFYRGGWCPYCNMEIHTLTSAYAEYQKRGVTPVAVSVDKPDVEAMMNAKYAIPFPVLSDSDAAMLHAFHVAKKLDDAELAQMKGFGVDLESYSGRAHHEIAIPSLFLVDRGGVVRWAHSDPDFKVRPTTAQILAAIDATMPPAR
jgi:peroxiredoxin